jgi:plasmid maintenance system antidote protein VapI
MSFINTALPQQNPTGLLDHIMNRLQLKNDAALSRALQVAPSVISKIRHFRLPVGAALALRIQEVTSMSLDEIRPFLAKPDE